MKKIVFADGTELECGWVEEGPVFYDNANRRRLLIQAHFEGTRQISD